jgi:hypothetical protein
VSLNIAVINALSELERYGWTYIPGGPDEVKCRCPVHDDDNPSVSLNISKNVWICHASQCTAKGDIIALLAYIGKVQRRTIVAYLLNRYPELEDTKTVDQAKVEKYHNRIWDSGPLLQELYKRGITKDDIREQRIGYDNGRIIIPVYNLQKQVVNLRKYLPGAPGPEKMKNLRGYKTQALYMPDRLKYPTVWVCGGELKAIVANRLLNQHNVGAVSVTGAEGSWHKSFTQFFKDKIVYICMDVDAGGIEAAKIVANFLLNTAQAVYIIKLPLDISKYPKGDLNDYIGQEKATDQDLLSLMKNADKFVPKEILDDIDDSEPKLCKLIEAGKAVNIGIKMQCDAVIATLSDDTFVVPKDVDILCSRDEGGCSYCLVNSKEPDPETGYTRIRIQSLNPVILNMMNSSPTRLRDAVLSSLNVPDCKSAIIQPISYYNIKDVRLTNPLEIDSETCEHIVQPAIIVSDKYLDMNIPYSIICKAFPHPVNWSSILLANDVIEKEDGITSYRFQPDEYEELKIFQPKNWSYENLVIKLDHIYKDLSNNVTRIFQRKDLHLAMDLAYHSVLNFFFEGKPISGLIDCLVTGDSSQGKSEVAISLIRHYGLGVRHDCGSATKAGLLGGLEKMGNTWFIKWGVIPLYDMQLVVLEELKGASVEVLGKLRDMRTSKIAEIVGIERRKTHARTRLIMISNPRSDRAVSAYNYGVSIVKELMGNLEDVRRFDYAVILAQQEIDNAVINDLQQNQNLVEPFYESKICKKGVLFAWTRKMNQIKFEDGFRPLCLEFANSLCRKYTESIPLCDKGTTRYKLTKIAIALACRTFSVVEGSCEMVLVRKVHVEYAYQFLDRIYSSPFCGYNSFSDMEAHHSRLRNVDLVRKELKETKHPKSFVQQLLYADRLNLTDIQSWCEIDRDTAQRKLSLLDRNGAVYRDPNSQTEYVKSSDFIALLKELLLDDSYLKDNIDVDAEF